VVRGDVGWAGGGAGPDFFIYLGKRPASWLKRDHTVWAEVADDESLALADRIVGLPSETPGGPNTSARRLARARAARRAPRARAPSRPRSRWRGPVARCHSAVLAEASHSRSRRYHLLT
jgi:hypothetical protein